MAVFHSDKDRAIAHIRKLLVAARQCDRTRLQRRLTRLERVVQADAACQAALQDLASDTDRSAQKLRRFQSQELALGIPPQLPIAARRDAIVAALRKHPVVIVAGDTGSGKTTQLPKLCLAAGRGTHGQIACTQPRRIAARTLAARVASEVNCELGTTVGYQVRFDERVSEDTRVRFMTDGMLLAHIQSDRKLWAFDTLLIDEAHERSLNIDLLLGYAKTLLKQRPELRVIVTSATIDTERFSAYFDAAPVVRVAGRTYPVEVRYRPPEQVKTGAQDAGNSALLAALHELDQEDARGDILVFLPGERAIRDAEAAFTRAGLRDTECLPLYARLSAPQQQRIFQPSRKRRIVLATNVAETSLTVPRIQFVIDTGLARISRYSHKSKVQRLPVETISQASAAQRAGRCGRLGPGICIRLYAQEDFDQRPEFTQPEILRTSLASVILRMADLGLAAIEEFEFLEPPPRALVTDGYRLLQELGAMSESRRLTRIGKRLALFPVDVRLARMLVAAAETEVLQPILVLVAGLSIQDPRERPADQAQAADQAHARFVDEKSDFMSLLKLWDFFQEQLRATSKSALRKRCQREFLSWRRLWEWRDLHRQLQRLCTEQGVKTGKGEADFAAIHKAILSGLLGHIGLRDEKRRYVGARGRGFQIFPGSALVGAAPKWIMSAFLVETARVYAQVNAAIEPAWIEQVGKHLVKRHCEDRYWDARSGRAMARVQTSLYGLVLSSQKRMPLSPLDPGAARELFIREALVHGQARLDAPFIDHNAALIKSIRDLEDKKRARDLLVDESLCERFFADSVPARIDSVKAFKRWYANARRDDPKCLYMRREMLLTGAAGPAAEDFPEQLHMDGATFSLRYRFERGAADDGVTIDVPVHLLKRVDASRLEWLVPGLILKKITALLRGLPKSMRRNFVPAPDFARACMAALSADSGPLYEALTRELQRMTGVAIPPGAWQPKRLEPHLLMNLRLLDDAGDVLVESRDVDSVLARYGARAEAAFAKKLGTGFFRDGIGQWDFGALPESVETESGGIGYPALNLIDGEVCLRLFNTRSAAAVAMGSGLRALLERTLTDKFRYLRKQLKAEDDEGLQYATVDRADALCADSVYHVSLRFCAETEHPRDAEAFAAFCKQARSRLGVLAADLLPLRRDVIARAYRLTRRINSGSLAAWPAARADLEAQLHGLVSPGFLRVIDPSRVPHLPRYLEAMQQRIDALPHNPVRDARRQTELQPFLAVLGTRDPTPDSRTGDAAPLQELRWMLEEFRVSLFAQKLGTAQPVSAHRLRKILHIACGGSD